MENNEKQNLLEEQLKEFRHRVNYVISETPRYRSLMGTNEEFDEVPVVTNEAGDQEDAEKPVPQPPTEPEAPTTGQPVGDAPIPAFDEPPAGDPAAGDLPADEPAAPIPPAEQAENQVDDLQNEIIKHNISAMRSIHDQLAGLSKNIDAMNSKMEELNADVEEVREPTDAEKLMKQSEVSYPYYFNLNDFWQDNWFDQRRNLGKDKGVRELPDGTYVADFDDLPLASKTDVGDSFNDMI
jgi:hypothetical protein